MRAVLMGAPIPPQEGFYNIDHPELEGVECQIQHGNQAGVIALGTLAVGVIIGPDGLPRMLVQSKHSDGAGLVAVLRMEEFVTLAECFGGASRKAAAIAAAAGHGGRA
jgi:hypothetical protein